MIIIFCSPLIKNLREWLIEWLTAWLYFINQFCRFNWWEFYRHIISVIDKQVVSLFIFLAFFKFIFIFYFFYFLFLSWFSPIYWCLNLQYIYFSICFHFLICIYFLIFFYLLVAADHLGLCEGTIITQVELKLKLVLMTIMGVNQMKKRWGMTK